MNPLKNIQAGKRSLLPALLMAVLLLFAGAHSVFAATHIITATAGPGGEIDPDGDVEVKTFRSKTFDIDPDKNYVIVDVLVDGESVGPVDKYKFSFVTRDHTIHATFAPKKNTIIASAGEGGEITPSGEVSVDRGDDESFEIEADPGYNILDVIVDDVSLGPLSKYTFTNVSSDHSIHVTFERKKYTITAISGVGGNISPSGEVIVEEGGGQSFGIDADPGFEILDVVVDDKSLGAISTYTFTNISSDHTISATFDRNLEILEVSIPNESMKIGDVIEASIQVSDDGGSAYNFVSGTVGGYLLERFERISPTSYGASFVIIEGGNSYAAVDAIPVSNLVISDGEINSPSYDLPIVQDNDPIDAEAPEIIQLEVPSLAVGVGGMVKLTISADGTGYSAASGTTINGIAWSSSRLIFTELGLGLYELSFIVEAGDANVEAGMLEASIELMDEAGNLSPIYNLIEPNSLEIYTALPEATLVGPDQICEGDMVELSVHLRGRSPWSFDLDDGINVTSFTDITLTDYKITVAPVQSTTYLISSVLDVNGVENTDNGNLLLTVDEVTDVEIINLAAGYDVDAEPVKLEANVPGGIFSGPGVISSSGFFYPDLADTIFSPHTIHYTYTNSNGCISADSVLVYVLGKEGGILIPATAFCMNENPFEVSVYNVPAEIGSFRLLDASSEPVSGLIDHGDNTATIDPDSLEIGNYTIEYQYLDLIVHTLTRDFSLESVEPPLILNLYDSSYCQNVLPFVLQSNLPNALFEGHGVTGSLNEGFTFTPSEADPGSIWITCTAESENGCKASTRESILIKFAPEVMFELSSECMPEGGELVSFDNQTLGSESVESWSWDFGDVGSGANNHSNLVDPTHQYQEPGLKSITLRASSFDGCSDSHTHQALIDSKPVADFDWISDCFSTGSAVKFVNRTSIGSATVETVLWTFKSSDGTVLDEIASSSVDDTVEYVFASPDVYQVELYSRNSGGCFSELSKEIILRPSVQLDSDGYFESFDDSEGKWTVRSDDQVESWVWGQADFTGYSPVEGDNAWFTQLPAGTDGYTENSWIQGPCYDFRGINRPLIRMELMRSFFPYLSGAVLQYREAIGEAWSTIGNETPGIGWYNVDNIINMPGGSSIGWGLEEFTPDSDWLTAIHDLDQLAGKKNVDLRIAFSSKGQMEVGNQGLAVNSLHIAERSKITLLEHFTNFTDDTARMADDIVDALAISHSKDVIDLQYHMGYPGVDQLNENNPDPPSTRSFNYGVPGVPYSVLDGGFSSNHRFDYSDLESGSLEDQLRLATLEIPAFDIELIVDWNMTGLEASTTVTCLADHYDDNIQLFMVVFESSLTTYMGGNGDTHFRNVVLDMLPTSAGKLLGNNWLKGNTDSRINTWDYEPYVEDLNDLAVVAFLQDRTSKQILQAVVDYKDETVGISDYKSLLESLVIYPNPAKHMIYVNLGATIENPGRLELMEMSGKAVLSEQVPVGGQIYQLDIERLNPGMYILRWVEADQLRGVSKFVKVQ